MRESQERDGERERRERERRRRRREGRDLQISRPDIVTHTARPSRHVS